MPIATLLTIIRIRCTIINIITITTFYNISYSCNSNSKCSNT